VVLTNFCFISGELLRVNMKQVNLLSTERLLFCVFVGTHDGCFPKQPNQSIFVMEMHYVS
jgi:hypothetical protein